MMAAIIMRGCSVQRTPFRQPCWLAAGLTCFQTSGVRNSRIEPESDSERFARRCAHLADAREEEAEHCAAMGPSLFPLGFWEEPRHDDKRRSHVFGPISSRKADSKPLPDNNPKHKPPKLVIGVGRHALFPFHQWIYSRRSPQGSRRPSDTERGAKSPCLADGPGDRSPGWVCQT